MKRDVQIVILSIQNAGGDPEAILTKTIGRYCFEEGCHKVTYRESDGYGTVTDNLLCLSQKNMSLKKSGSIAGEFLFDPDRNTDVDYRTSFGKIVFQVETEFYTMSKNENNLNVQLKYKLHADSQLFSENTLTIQIHEQEKVRVMK